MLTQHRKKYILDVLQKEGQVIAKNLAVELDLSEDTIRRDLRELAKDGLLRRVHGGAMPIAAAEADFNRRQSISTDGKRAIGQVAAGLIQPGQIIILDGGTTAVQLARHLPANLQATIVTHSPTIAVELANHPTVEVILIGGKLFKHSVVTVGTAALEALKHIHADIYFMGVTGVHAETGLSTGDLEEAHMKKALSEHAAETIVLASDEKLNVVSPYMILPIKKIASLVVDSGASQQNLEPFKNLGLTVIKAG
ncbi:MAG: DeoR/GlpR family DNA-binding transcription regulator [Chloroflexota bacterium]